MASGVSISKTAEGESKMRMKKARGRTQKNPDFEKDWPHRKEKKKKLELAAPKKLVKGESNC